MHSPQSLDTFPPPRQSAAGSRAGCLADVRWIDLPSHRDDRGVLTAVESGRDLPFDVERVYFVHDVVADRGGHAHRDTEQVVVPVAGRCTIVLSDGCTERSWAVDGLSRGLYIGPMLFIRMTDFAPGTVLASFASTHYDPARSIRSWADYLRAVRA